MGDIKAPNELKPLIPYPYRCPKELQNVLHFGMDEKLYFVFGDNCISLELIKALAENIGVSLEGKQCQQIKTI